MNYKSSIQLLGIPLVHVAIGPSSDSSGPRGIAKGWIAIGDIAFGVAFAFGGLAVGGVALGGLSLGVLAIAGMCVGVWSVGGLAIGVFALGGAAIGVRAAIGGLAVAGEYAIGGMVLGAESSAEAAREYFDSSLFFSVAERAARHARLLLLMPILLPFCIWFMNRRARRST